MISAWAVLIYNRCRWWWCDVSVKVMLLRPLELDVCPPHSRVSKRGHCPAETQMIPCESQQCALFQLVVGMIFSRFGVTSHSPRLWLSCDATYKRGFCRVGCRELSSYLASIASRSTCPVERTCLPGNQLYQQINGALSDHRNDEIRCHSLGTTPCPRPDHPQHIVMISLTKASPASKEQ